MKRWFSAIPLLTAALIITCNKYPDQPLGDYRLKVTWPANTGSLVLFTQYHFSYQTGQDNFNGIYAYTTPAGFIDTAFVNQSIRNSAAKWGTVYFIRKGQCRLYVEGRTGDGRRFADSCNITAVNPFSIAGDTVIGVGDTAELCITPRPNLDSIASPALIEWKVNGAPIEVAEVTDTFSFSGYVAGTYSIIASFVDTNQSKNFSAALDTFTVKVVDNGIAPTITTQPKSQTLYLGQPVTFTVVATGTPAPTYQWEKNGAVILNANGSFYTINAAAISDSGKYTVTMTNSAGSVTSDTARFYAGVKSMAAGGSHSLILKTDGTLFACGNNHSGQLGDGTTTDRHSPVLIMTDVQGIAAGGVHSLILKTDGTLFACGYNGVGQLGDGTTTDRHSPVLIMTDVQGIAAGGDHSLILKTDRTLFACGNNHSGQLGDGTTTDRHFPVQIMSGVQGIAAGGCHSLILKTDGTLFACGLNLYGQLGDSTTTDQHSSVQIMTGVQGIAAGGYHSLILKTDGTLFACGLNFYGQLGDGTTTDQHSPVEITF